MSPSSPHNINFDGASHINMETSAVAKQMASLSAVGLARAAKVPPGPSVVHPQPPQSGGSVNSGSYLGAMTINSHSTGHDNAGGNPFGVSPIFPSFQGPNAVAMTQQQQLSSNQGNLSLSDSNMASTNRQQLPAATLKQRQRNFLNGLTSVMSAKGTPLPPALTGVANSQYDPTTSPWKALEPSPTEVGAFRLAGKDVDLFRLWGLVFQAGGHAKVCYNVTPFSVALLTLNHISSPNKMLGINFSPNSISQNIHTFLSPMDSRPCNLWPEFYSTIIK